MKTIYSILFFILLAFYVNGQVLPSSSIKGTVTDSLSNKPVGYATLILKSEELTTLRSSVSKTDGSFTFNPPGPAKFLLSVVCVGYQSKMVPVTLSVSSLNHDLGVIKLTPATSRLKEVVVISDRPLVRQEIDRISYNVKADPESRVNSVLEMMRKVPLLSLDAEDQTQLQGSTNYKILINGKPSSLVDRSPLEILRSMPASTIERIEVITTPPAKYDGEGLAGIINIITNKKTDNGYNGTVNINERFPVGGLGIGTTLTGMFSKFGVAISGGASQNNTPQIVNRYERFNHAGMPTTLLQNGTRKASGKSGYLGAELSYEMDNLNLIAADFYLNGNDSENSNFQSSALSRTAGSLLQSYQLWNSLEVTGKGIDASFNYQRGFKKDKSRLMTFSYRYLNALNTLYNNVDIVEAVSYDLPDYRQNNNGRSAENTFQLDYVQQLKKVSMEAGIKAIFRGNGSTFNYRLLNESSTIFETDPARTNDFKNDQNVFGIYNTYQFSIKSWGVKAGLRVEKTINDADFISAAARLHQDYLNLIPSVSLNWKLKNSGSINFGYTSRIQRPGINQLNPFVDRSNPNLEISGNPELKAMTAHSFEASYSIFKKLSLILGSRVILLDNVIMRQISVDPVTNVTRSAYGNTGSSKIIAAYTNLNYPVTQKLRLSVNTLLNYGLVKGEVNGFALQNEGLMSWVFATAGYRFDKGWQANSSFSYNSGNISLQSRTNSFTGSSLSGSKDLLKDKLSISVAANNVFTKYRNIISTTTRQNFEQQTFNQTYLRNFTASINYRFGGLKEKLKKNKRGIDNNDVSDNSDTN